MSSLLVDWRIFSERVMSLMITYTLLPTFSEMWHLETSSFHLHDRRNDNDTGGRVLYIASASQRSELKLS